ncbi:hypothetical protein EVAR_95308_1 [Eumeta japonica]|uniref:Uncharacterized protein n=1 Tax=Eumeta variegata TaxID=151549 RepID=A0A4C1U9D3_EUMVA|nr:hypothetical protein EVAR_95308_1 [Eumeta japonica]
MNEQLEQVIGFLNKVFAYDGTLKIAAYADMAAEQGRLLNEQSCVESGNKQNNRSNLHSSQSRGAEAGLDRPYRWHSRCSRRRKSDHAQNVEGQVSLLVDILFLFKKQTGDSFGVTIITYSLVACKLICPANML